MQIKNEFFNRISRCCAWKYLAMNIDSIHLSTLEEIGELSTELSIKQNWKKRDPSPDGVLGECVDVFICLASIGLYEESGFTDELNHQLKLFFLAKESGNFDLRINVSDYMQRIVKSVFDDGELPSTTCILTLDLFFRYGGTPETFLERMDKKITKWEENNVQSGM